MKAKVIACDAHWSNPIISGTNGSATEDGQQSSGPVGGHKSSACSLGSSPKNAAGAVGPMAKKEEAGESSSFECKMQGHPAYFSAENPPMIQANDTRSHSGEALPSKEVKCQGRKVSAIEGLSTLHRDGRPTQKPIGVYMANIRLCHKFIEVLSALQQHQKAGIVTKREGQKEGDTSDNREEQDYRASVIDAYLQRIESQIVQIAQTTCRVSLTSAAPPSSRSESLETSRSTWGAKVLSTKSLFVRKVEGDSGGWRGAGRPSPSPKNMQARRINVSKHQRVSPQSSLATDNNPGAEDASIASTLPLSSSASSGSSQRGRSSSTLSLPLRGVVSIKLKLKQRQETLRSLFTVSRTRQARRLRFLLARKPYVELGAEQSHLSLMHKLLGQNFTHTWWRAKAITAPAAWLAFVFAMCALPLTLILGPAITDTVKLTTGLLCVAAGLYCGIFSTSLMNYRLLCMMLSTFDLLFLFTEMFLYVGSLVIVLCGAPIGYCAAISIAFGYFFTIVYDCFPLSIRKKCRAGLLVACIWNFLLWLILYTQPPEGLCRYHVNMRTGQLTDEHYNGWKFSLFDFCLNRGLNIVILFTKMTCMTFKYPTDCVVLKSRLRLMECEVANRTPYEDDLSSTSSGGRTGEGSSDGLTGPIGRVKGEDGEEEEEKERGSQKERRKCSTTALCDSMLAYLSTSTTFHDHEWKCIVDVYLLLSEMRKGTTRLKDANKAPLLAPSSTVLSPVTSLSSSTPSDGEIPELSSGDRPSSGDEATMIGSHQRSGRFVFLAQLGRGGHEGHFSASRRTKGKYALTVVKLHSEMTEQESGQTVMMLLFGQKFTEVWFQWRRLLTPLARLSFVTYMAMALVLIMNAGSPSTEALMGSLLLLNSLIMMIFYSSLMNYWIFRCCLRMFDVAFFMVHLLVYSFFLASALCFTPGGWCLGISWFLANAITFFYDSMPLRTRNKSKGVAFLGTVFVIVVELLYYTRLTPGLCIYRVGMSDDGNVWLRDNELHQGLSVFEAGLNSGLTLIVLLSRICFAVINDPEDCVVLRTRMRLIAVPDFTAMAPVDFLPAVQPTQHPQ